MSLSFFRTYATKVPVSLVAALRKTHPVPMAQAREALERSNLDLEKAIAYLSGTSARKAEKVKGRSTNEGTIAVSLLGGKRASIVQLACETDFVARNDVFLKAARGVAETAAFLDVPTEGEPQVQQSTSIQTFPVESLLSAPLIVLPTDGSEPIPHSPETIDQVLLASLAQTGENLKLLRAATFAAPFPSKPDARYVPGGYTHSGKVGGIVVLKVEGREGPIASLVAENKELDGELQALGRNVARQVVGFPTKAIDAGEDEETLLKQPAMMMGSDKSVAEALEQWGKDKGVKVQVVDMRRWAVGEEHE